MNKIKTMCILLMLCLTAGILPQSVFAGYTDVYEYDSYFEAVNRLSDLGIVSGYEDGSFRADKPITRAEFARLVVSAMDKDTEAQTYGSASRFFDVEQGSWAVPYIAYVAAQGLVAGYPDGSFGPYNTITYAEALTIIGKMLGYTENTIGSYWPNNYIEASAKLGITSGINFYPKQEINRAMAAIVIDRALFTEVFSSGVSVSQGTNNNTQSSSLSTSESITSKSDKDSREILSEKSATASNGYTKSSISYPWGNGDGNLLIEILGYTIVEDALVLSTGADDESLFEDEIKLNNNVVYSTTINSPVYTGDLLEYAVVNSDGDMVCVRKYDEGNSKNNKYTTLENCYIIASSFEDRTLSSSQIRTNKGVFTVSDTDILTKVGEVGKLVLDKEKKVLSASTSEAPYKEYVVSDIDGDTIKFITDNKVQTLSIAADFPVFVDYGAKETFEKAKKKFTSGSELIMYSRDGYTWDCAVLDRNSGYTVKNECFIAASKNEDESLSANQVRTSDGVYAVTNTDMLDFVGKIGTVLIDSTNRIEQFAPIDKVSQSVVVNRVSGNTVNYSGADGVSGSFKFDNTFVTYVDYAKSTYAMAQNSIDVGTTITFYGDNYGSWNFAVIDEGNDITPVLASHDYTVSDNNMEGITIKHEGLTVYRDGEAATLDDIEKNDVVYYNTAVNTMDVYTKKVTGIYYDALPSKAYVTEVTVGGKNYTIGENSATQRLDASSGSFAIGDKVTLLLGKNDEVVFAVELTDFDAFDYGVVVSAGQKVAESGVNEGSSEKYVNIYMPDGETYEYTATKDYSDYKGYLVNVTYSDGKVSLTKVSDTTKAYGKVDITNRTIGGKAVLKDVRIIQRITDEDDTAVELETLNFETLEASELTVANVIASVSANKFGDVAILYVTGLSGSSHYGIMRARTDTEPYTYSIYSNSGMNKYSSDGKFSIASGEAVSYNVLSSGKITGIKALYRLSSSSGIDAVEGSRIMINGTIYKMSSEVEIVDVTNSDSYRTLSIEELEKQKISNVTIYSDKPLAEGGIVKVVKVTLKK